MIAEAEGAFEALRGGGAPANAACYVILGLADHTHVVCHVGLWGGTRGPWATPSHGSTRAGGPRASPSCSRELKFKSRWRSMRRGASSRPNPSPRLRQQGTWGHQSSIWLFELGSEVTGTGAGLRRVFVGTDSSIVGLLSLPASCRSPGNC